MHSNAMLSAGVQDKSDGTGPEGRSDTQAVKQCQGYTTLLRVGRGRSDKAVGFEANLGAGASVTSLTSSYRQPIGSLRQGYKFWTTE